MRGAVFATVLKVFGDEVVGCVFLPAPVKLGKWLVLNPFLHLMMHIKIAKFNPSTVILQET